jgi:hypothetical protein
MHMPFDLAYYCVTASYVLPNYVGRDSVVADSFAAKSAVLNVFNPPLVHV